MSTAQELAAEQGYTYLYWKRVIHGSDAQFFSVARDDRGQEVNLAFKQAHVAQIAPWAKWVATGEGKPPVVLPKQPAEDMPPVPVAHAAGAKRGR